MYLRAQLFRLVEPILDQVHLARVDQRTQIRIFLAGPHFQLFGLFCNDIDDLVGLSDNNRHGKSHTPLATGSETGTDDRVGGLFERVVWHHDAVVLGPCVALHTFSIFTAFLVDVLADSGRPDEGNGLDVWMRQDAVHGGLASLDHVDYSLRQRSLLQQLHQSN